MDKKEFYWVVNNIIDIIKEFNNSERDRYVEGPICHIDESGEVWKIILQLINGDLSIVRRHERGFSRVYIDGKVNISKFALNNLKEEMFKIKKEIKC